MTHDPVGVGGLIIGQQYQLDIGLHIFADNKPNQRYRYELVPL
jgi:hypothetical protein